MHQRATTYKPAEYYFWFKTRLKSTVWCFTDTDQSLETSRFRQLSIRKVFTENITFGHLSIRDWLQEPHRTSNRWLCAVLVLFRSRTLEVITPGGQYDYSGVPSFVPTIPWYKRAQKLYFSTLPVTLIDCCKRIYLTQRFLLLSPMSRFLRRVCECHDLGYWCLRSATLKPLVSADKTKLLS